MPDLQLSPEGEAFIRGFETLRLVGYLPTPKDKPTIGWGHTGMMPDGKTIVTVGASITEEQAEGLFRQDIGWAMVAANNTNRARVGNANPPLLQSQFDSLVSLIFNIGKSAFLQSHVRQYIIGGNEQQTRTWWLVWNRQDGEVLGGLVARREAEWHMWSNMGTVT